MYGIFTMPRINNRRSEQTAFLAHPIITDLYGLFDNLRHK